MAETLTAPISEAQYRIYNLLKLPEGFTGDGVTLLLNEAWAAFKKEFGLDQPIEKVTNTDVYEFPSRYCNLRPDGVTVIVPKYLPLVSVTTVKYAVISDPTAWVSCTVFATLKDTVLVTDGPFVRGDTGLFQLVYDSGYVTVPADLKLACALMVHHHLAYGFYPTQSGAIASPDKTEEQLKAIASRYQRVR